MPCDTVQLNRVELDLSKRDLLIKALKASGCTVPEGQDNEDYLYFYHPNAVGTCQVKRNKEGKFDLTVRAGYEFVADQIKQAYGKACIETAANKIRWNMKPAQAKTPNAVAAFSLSRRF